MGYAVSVPPCPLSPRALLGLALALGACDPRDPAGPAEQRVIIGRGRDALTLDPARVTDSESTEVCEQIYEHLVRFRLTDTGATGDVEPELAERWEQSGDGKTWTFFLRKGVRFHDGSPMDAESVVFSFERQRDRAHPGHRGDYKYWETSFKNIQRVEKVDPHTVRITIEIAHAPFLSNLAMTPVAIVSPSRTLSTDGLERNPSGTGPFRFVRWTKDGIVLRRNAAYWGNAPRIETLVYRSIPDPRQRLVALESEAIDVAYSISPGDMPYVRLHPELVPLLVEPFNVAYLAMQTKHPPFDDARVRRAVNHAVNKLPIVRLLYQQLAVPALGPLPERMLGYEPNVRRYAYDPQRARSLLAEAGYDQRLRPKLYVMREERPYLPHPERVAEVIQKNLAEVGMKVDIVVNSFATHLDVTDRGEHDLALRGWTSDNADPDNILILLDRDNARPGGQNAAYYTDPFVHGQLEWARLSFDKERRAELYRSALRRIAEDAPWVPLAHARVPIATRRDVRGLRHAPSGVLYYRDVFRTR